MTATTTAELSWAGADEIAARLGGRTRRLVADRDPEAVIGWARRMGREHQGPAANTYIELAVLLEQPQPAEPEPLDDEEQDDGDGD